MILEEKRSHNKLKMVQRMPHHTWRIMPDVALMDVALRHPQALITGLPYL